VIFVDTSALYALADAADPNHGKARQILESILDREVALLTHSYVLVESIALVQHRLGTAPALSLAESRGFEVEWVDAARHREAVRALGAKQRRRVSFVDLVSFSVMRARAIRTAFAFDADFEREGFVMAAAG
jgi:predicted nucleic acid-binding protein